MEALNDKTLGQTRYALVRPNSFEDICDVLNGPGAETIRDIVSAQNRVRTFLRKAGELKRLGFWDMIDARQLGSFCLRQIAKDWDCCAELVTSTIHGSVACPDLYEDAAHIYLEARFGNCGVLALIFLAELKWYWSTVVPTEVMNIALSVRHAVDGLVVVDCKNGDLPLGGRVASENQECMLLACLLHPSSCPRRPYEILVPLATWPMQKYE
jgi:hypothetical protein